MASIYNHIRDAINEDINIEYKRAVLFAHVLEGAVSGFLIYNAPESAFFKDIEKCNKSLNMCENVWETERLNGCENLWSAIIYIIDAEGERYELLYENDFDVKDLLNVKIGAQIETKYFPNMTYKR